MKKISILGTGWLGLPLAKLLLKEGISIKGSTTSIGRIPFLRNEGIEPFRIKVAAEGIEGDLEGFLDSAEVLIIDFPPGLRKDPKMDYSGAVSGLAEGIAASGVKKVIFVSSISVYEETEKIPVYTEASEANSSSISGKEIISAEKILLNNPLFETTVIRFGGLIGEGRHPVKYLAGRSGLPDPLGPVNLIHLKDCLEIIQKVLKKNIFGEIFNGVYPYNPSREAYYTQTAEEAGLPQPVFDHSEPSVGKIISASKVMRELDVSFSKKI